MHEEFKDILVGKSNIGFESRCEKNTKKFQADFQTGNNA